MASYTTEVNPMAYIRSSHEIAQSQEDLANYSQVLHTFKNDSNYLKYFINDFDSKYVKQKKQTSSLNGKMSKIYKADLRPKEQRNKKPRTAFDRFRNKSETQLKNRKMNLGSTDVTTPSIPEQLSPILNTEENSAPEIIKSFNMHNLTTQLLVQNNNNCNKNIDLT